MVTRRDGGGGGGGGRGTLFIIETIVWDFLSF